MKLVNLTNIPMKVGDKIYPACSEPVWVELEKFTQDAPIEGLPTYFYSFKEFVNLPDVDSDTLYIVPHIVCEWAVKEFGWLNFATAEGLVVRKDGKRYVEVEFFRTASFGAYAEGMTEGDDRGVRSENPADRPS